MPKPLQGLSLPLLFLSALLGACGGKAEPSTELQDSEVGPESELTQAAHVPAPPGPSQERNRFVSDVGCASCHPGEAAAWGGSHHDLAMQPATPATVLGDFADSSFEHLGQAWSFSREGDDFLVQTESSAGLIEKFRVLYTFGVEPLQQYLIEADAGRLQCLTAAWDTNRKQWFSLYPDERFEAGDPFHWSGRYQRWNLMCAACHSTDLRAQYDLESDSYSTTWEEIDVGCQACHGPGQEHIAWAQQSKPGESYGAEDTKGLARLLRRGAPAAQIDSCAPCHSRRHALDSRWDHTQPFLDEFQPSLLRQDLYHPDGQMIEEVYVWGSFAQSAMHQAGVACSDCHDPHSLKPLAKGNALCAQCHSTFAPLERFPTLTVKDYDSPEHHHHSVGSAGAQCVNCHMPARTYMVVDERRDHSFRIPRPDLSDELGTPNTCNACHADQSSAWAASKIVEWFGPERKPHFGRAIAAGQNAAPGANDLLHELIGDSKAPGIARATAIPLYTRVETDQVKLLELLVERAADTDPLVRGSALESLAGAPTGAVIAAAGPRLQDPLRSVRIHAARAMLGVQEREMPTYWRAAFAAAKEEFIASQLASGDLPSAHLNLAVMHAQVGDKANAEHEYRLAIELDRAFLPARFNLANLLNEMGRDPEAEKILRDGIREVPDEGELHYSLGLLLGEMRNIEAAAESLGRAAELMPDRARVANNYGLALHQLGRLKEAEEAFLNAHRLAPKDPSPPQSLIDIYVSEERWTEAHPLAQLLASQFPGEVGFAELLVEIERELGQGDH